MEISPTSSVRLVRLGFLLSGSAALIYEVTWTRALSLVVGSTTYAVSTMLATFMLGLALGSYLGGRLADRNGQVLRWFALCELGIGVTGLLSIPLLYALPRAYLWVFRTFHLEPTLYFALQIGLCGLVMLVPTTLMGATFPLVTRGITSRLEEMGKQVGGAYSLNTLGAVGGSIAAGFILIPSLGLSGAVMAAAGLNLAVGVAVLLTTGPARLAPIASFLILYLASGAWASTAQQDQTTLSLYTAHRAPAGISYDQLLRLDQKDMTVLFDRFYPEGHVKALRTAEGFLLMQLGGKLEGTGPLDVENTVLLSRLPVASHSGPERILVIGLGAGVTVAAAKQDVAKVEVVEINPGVVEAVSRFAAPGLLQGVEVVLDDARSHLAKTDRSYDVITSEPSYPTESGVANLFTREFFQIASRRLNPGGVFAQWLPYYLLTNDDVTMMIATFASVFPHVYLWKVPTGLDLIMVGSLQPFSRDARQIQERLTEINRAGPPLRFSLSRTPAEVTQLVATGSIPLNTDDHPLLEFRAARNVLAGDLAPQDIAAAGRGGQAGSR